jgi:hypothetical protein
MSLTFFDCEVKSVFCFSSLVIGVLAWFVSAVMRASESMPLASPLNTIGDAMTKLLDQPEKLEGKCP